MRARFALALAVAVTFAGGCARLAPSRGKVPLSIDPPSARELAACDLSLEEEPAEHGTYTDRYGNTYGVIAHQGLDPTLVETIEPAQGGPLGPPVPAQGEATSEWSDVPPADLATASGDSSAPLEPDPLDVELGNHRMRLHWPLPATGVTSLFGTRRDPVTGKSRYHYGVDLQGQYGELIRASAGGVVIYASWNHGHGRQVIIEHPGGWRSSYSHLAQQIVSRGQRVRAGQAIGQVGNSGRSTGPHLHLEITRWGSYFDPLDVLGTTVAID